MSAVLVSGPFDNLRSEQVRFLQEASRLGPVHAFVWSDEVVHHRTGALPRFLLDERRYFLRALRWVTLVHVLRERTGPDALPPDRLEWLHPTCWAVHERDDTEGKRLFCQAQALTYHVVRQGELAGFPDVPPDPPTGRRKVIVTGCYDWLHTGHVRFFEEASQLGDLIVAVGHDANVRALKGERHPLLSEDERLYMVASVRHVHQAVLTTGDGWMDAAPEIERLRPDVYVVNEDGDKPEKRDFCRERGLEYVVLSRQPRHGLPRRESTQLRGF